MGWTSMHRGRGLSNAEFFAEELGSAYEIVECATVRQVFYAAVKRADTGQVFGYVALMKWAPRSQYNFTYKTMDETCGPTQTYAPAKVLDALGETDSQYALEWRAACRKNLDARAAKPRPRRGQLVTFAIPLAFTNGDQHTTLEFLERSTFRDPLTQTLYRIPAWRQREFELANDGDLI